MVIDVREVPGATPPKKKPSSKKTVTPTPSARTVTQQDLANARQQLEQLATSGASNLEQAAMSTITASKGLDRIAARQMGVGEQALPTGTAPDIKQPPPTTTLPTTVTPKKIVSTFTNDKGQQVAVYDDGSTTIIGQATDKTAERKSAFDLLKQEFTRYGLGSLVGDTLTLAQEGVSPAEFSLRLRQLPAYQSRFAANDTRLKNGLSALSEAQYVALEDRYQQIMQEYGVPKSFYAKQVDAKTGIEKQPELEKIIAGDVSPVELETRINTAINRVKNASPEVMSALQQFYPGVTQENLVAYVLDPVRALPDIQRQVQAAEVGGMATRFGLAASRASAEQLAAAGVTKEQAQQGYQTIAEILPRGSQLASIYKESPYTQATAEQEVFGTAGAAEAAKQRKKLTQLEQASFSGQSGMGALARDRAGAF